MEPPLLYLPGSNRKLYDEPIWELRKQVVDMMNKDGFPMPPDDDDDTNEKHVDFADIAHRFYSLEDQQYYAVNGAPPPPCLLQEKNLMRHHVEDTRAKYIAVFSKQLNAWRRKYDEPAAAIIKSPLTFSLRPPTKATNGNKCMVKANHFLVQLSNPLLVIYHYHVSIHREVIPNDARCHLSVRATQDNYKTFIMDKRTSVNGHMYCQRCCDNHPDVMPSTSVTSSENRDVMAQLVNLYKESHLGNKLPAYDGKNSLYTAGPLPFVRRDFKITLHSKVDNKIGFCCDRETSFKVSIKYASRVDTSRMDSTRLGMFLLWRQEHAPPEALKALNVVLGQFPSNQYTPVGRSFYDPCLGRSSILGNGLYGLSGFYQNLRPMQMGLSLNIDMSSTVFIEPLPVTEFISQLLKKDISAKRISDADHVKIEKALTGLKVELLRKKYCISGLTWKRNFPVDDIRRKSSKFRYFEETYGLWIQHTDWPCLQVGNTQKPRYLPMERCYIVKDQRYSKRLNELQASAFLKVTHQSAQERATNIMKTVHLNNDNNGDYAKEFGIKINTNLTSVEARILPSPRLKYHDHGLEGDYVPQGGVWNMKNKKMVNGGGVEHWTCINFEQTVSVGLAHDFCHALAMKCRDMGMEFNLVPVIPVRRCHPDQVKRALEDYREKIELLLVILPDDNGSLYGDLKRICETDIGIVSQCCLRKHVIRMRDLYLTNVALKINVKVGGRNTVLADALSKRIPNVSDYPTIIFGADVTHRSSPSIAAVVASQDWPEITKYAALVCSQAHRKEIIEDLFKKWQDPIRGEVCGGMIRELLLSFYRATGRKPVRIIFYRDGVSEGQFYQVLSYELDAIRQACASLEDHYQPPVTFVMVQKRHHTRLFANDNCDRKSMDGIGNVLPGTVVDSKICHPTQFDFYLCSHAGIQGSSRPVHYHVLWDENNFSADDLQSLTNNLCYTYARCTRSVSIVPPAYYAHLAAFRARFYLEPDDNDSKISAAAAAAGCCDMGTGGKSTPVPGANAAAVRPLPALHANVKCVMFYC